MGRIDQRIACAMCDGDGMAAVKPELPREDEQEWMRCPACSGTGVASAEECAIRTIDAEIAKYPQEGQPFIGLALLKFEIACNFLARDAALKR